MAVPAKTQDALPTGKALSAMLALLIAEREERLASSPNGHGARKTEVILAAGGLSPAEIAPLMGKNLDAVRKAIQRGRDS